MEVMDILIDALLDSLKLLPFLLLMHILIELYEHKADSRLNRQGVLSNKLSPLLGAGLGLVPQCGFSVVATKLYSNKKIALGTLVAIYIATSDEAIPVILAEPKAAIKLLPLLIIKFVFAVAAGFILNAILAKKQPTASIAAASDEAQDEQCHHGCHSHVIGKKEKPSFLDFMFHPLVHTLTVFLYVLAVNIAFGFIVNAIGEDKLMQALESARLVQPLIAAVIGLIPNCAASVLLARTYAMGAINLGAAVAGLSVNAGIAFAVLFKENKNIKQNIFIIVGLFIAAAALGTLIALLL